MSHRRTIELQSVQNERASFDSLLSSLDEPCFTRQNCDVIIYDDVPPDLDGTEDNGVILEKYSRHRFERESSLNSHTTQQDDLQRLNQRLHSRDPGRTRWVNIVGWSRSVVDMITARHLGTHGCLDIDELSMQTLGGPLCVGGDSEIIWFQTQMWFIGSRAKCWASLRTIKVRMIVCLPTADRAGTLLTNFVGPFRLADEISSVLNESILDNHPFGIQSMKCVWILSFALMHVMAEQVDFAFGIFDPIEVSAGLSRMPRLDELPEILQKANKLVLVRRYLSRLEEFTSFFASVQELLPSSELPCRDHDTASFDSVSVANRARFEARRAQRKIHYQKELCRMFIEPFDNLIQMMISYSTTQITLRLDSGRHVAEQFAKIGVVIASIASITAPLGLLTSYFGMNVKELTDDALGDLYSFWKIGIPVLLLSIVLNGFLGLWLFLPSRRPGMPVPI